MTDMTVRRNNYLLVMVYTSLMTALVFVTTFSIRVPVPFTSGYIHPGDVMVFLSGLLLGPFFGAFAAGIGSALSDIIAGYTFWALPTLIIKGLMAYSVGMIGLKLKPRAFHLLSIVGSIIWIGFTAITYFLTRQAKGNQTVFDSTIKALLNEGYDEATINSLSETLSSTGNYLIAILIALPIIVIAMIIFAKKQENNQLTIQMLFSFVIGGIIMIIGYYITYGILAGNFIVPIFSIPANVMQFIFGFLGAVLLSPIFLKFRQQLNNQ